MSNVSMENTATAVSVRLLGRTALRVGDEYRDAGTPKQAGVLAALAWNVGTPVPLETLLDRLWGERMPGTARRTYAGYIARLRKAVAECGGRVEWTGDGYALHLDPEAVDLHRMRALTARARQTAETDPDAASALRRQALDLWRGLPLTGAWGEWAARVRGGLERELHGLRCEHLAAELALGRHETTLPELTELSQLNPLDQNVASLHMLALHHSGQTDVALRRYRSLRRRLREELGVEPAEPLAETHRRILRDDPALREPAAPAPRELVLPRQLPAAPRPFVGRESELSRLDTLAAPNSALPLVGITGPGGIGKTALGLWWAQSRADRFPDGQLYVDLRGFSAGEPMAADRALAGFLRGLGIPDDRVPADTAEKGALYRSLLADKRMLVFCDNAADSAQVEPLLPGGTAAMTIATSRDDLAAIRVAHGLGAIRLAGLERSDSRRLLELTAEVTEPDQAARAEDVAELCGDFPLALRLAGAQVHDGELSRLAGQLSADPLSTLASDGGDLAMRGCFDLSYRNLDPLARRVFHALGLHPGPECAAEPLAALLDASVTDVVAGLRRLTTRNLVDRAPHDRWRVHDLIHGYARERAVAEESEADRHRAAGRMYDWYLAAAVRAGTAAFQPPQPLSEPEPVVAVPDLTDPATAMDWLDRNYADLIAVIRTAADDHPHHSARMAVALERYPELRRHLDDWDAYLPVAIAACRRAGDDRLESALHLNAAVAASVRGRLHDSQDALRRASRIFERLSDEDGSVRVRDNLVYLQMMIGEAGDGDVIEHFSRSAEFYRRVGDHRAQATAEHNLSTHEFQRGRLDLALKYEQRALDTRLANDIRIFQSCAYGYVARIQLHRGDLDSARYWLDRSVHLDGTIQKRLNPHLHNTRMGLLETLCGNHTAALKHHAAALSEIGGAVFGHELPELYGNAAAAHAAIGEHALALEYRHEALRAATAERMMYEQAAAHHGIALALRALRRDDPEDHRGAAVAAYRRVGAQPPADLEP